MQWKKISLLDQYIILNVIGKLLGSELSFPGVIIILAVVCNKINGVVFIRFLIQRAQHLLREPHV